MNESRHKQYIKTFLTKGSVKLSLGLESTHRHEKYTLHANILCLIKFLSGHILQRGKGIVDSVLRERMAGVRTYVTTLSSRKLHSAISEIVSLVWYACIFKR